MPTNILEDVSRELADAVDRATDDEKRALCVPASQLAISRTNRDEPLISEAMRVLETTNHKDEHQTAALEKLRDDLDLRYFAAEERYRAGEGDKDTYIALARKATAANAVLSAFSDDAFKAATYCLYETYCAGASVEEIEAIVTDTLNQVRARS